MATTLVFILGLVMVFSSTSGLPAFNECGNDVEGEVTSFFNVIQRSLNRFEENPDSITADVILAFIFSREFLADGFRNEPISKKLDTLIYGFLRKDFGNHNMSTQLIPLMLNPGFWEGVVKPLKANWDSYRFELPNLVASSQLDDNNEMNWNTDECLLELFYSNCRKEPVCMGSISSLSGYAATHLLLLHETASQLGCESSAPGQFSSFDMEERKENVCEIVLQDMKGKSSAEMTLEEKDIFLEQIVLCGLEGFVDFANDKWRSLVKSWETAGCFGSQIMNTRKIRLRKKNDTTDKTGCHTHPTALGIAASSFFIRYLYSRCYIYE